MDDQGIGWSLRLIRTRKGWRQEDLAMRAGVSRWVVLRIEQGRLGGVPLGKIRAVAGALDARLDSVVRWQGGDLGRLVSARHARMHELMARFFGDLPGWIAERKSPSRSTANAASSTSSRGTRHAGSCWSSS
ncbi:MAG: helix-turn-helix transcriptional regulator [Chloroflexi bacterium]|nr:helix-turn-helix transcriptional regulator [Chloroflexota bacterium]